MEIPQEVLKISWFWYSWALYVKI